MVKRFIFIFLALNLLVLSGGVDAKAKAEKSFSEVNGKLKLLNKPAVKSIKSKDGDIIDCVDIYKQPTFDHPAFKNHTIQIRPRNETSGMKNESSDPAVPSQTWQKSGRCPEGTVAIRRVRRKELLRADSIEHFGRYGPQTSSAVSTTSTNDRNHNNHSSAFLVSSGYNFLGAGGDINVWSPRVESSDEYTSAQIWLKNDDGDNIEILEAGWMVNPKLFGDAKPRLFGRWTMGGYTGCINLLCYGFIQTSKKIALGAVIEPLSQRGGRQYHIHIRIEIEPASSDSWRLYFGNELIGYWPASLFYHMQHGATKVQWGGDVYSSKIKSSPHTRTAMGSGHFAKGLWGVASFINKPRITITPGRIFLVTYPLSVFNFSDEPGCYTAYNYQKNPADPPIFYFGGPGQNPNCQ